MEKENAIENFNNMIIKSWTYEKLTETQKKQWKNALDTTPIKKEIKGTYKQRWDILNGIYTAFLYGCGYPNSLFKDMF